MTSSTTGSSRRPSGRRVGGGRKVAMESAVVEYETTPPAPSADAEASSGEQQGLTAPPVADSEPGPADPVPPGSVPAAVAPDPYQLGRRIWPD